jgi:DNA-binding response OmpR family regulator
MRLLVVEDDPNLNQVLGRGLKEEGYAVDLATDGEEGLYLAETVPYDLILLDWMLPKLSGITVCQKLRAKNMGVPVLLLTAKTALTDKVEGLDSGADDYLTKPFEFEELLARVRALLRRQAPVKSNLLQVGDLSLEVRTRMAQRGGTAIELTTKEFALLEYFMRNPGVVLTRQNIEENAWNYDFESQSNLIEVYIRRLRRKIDDPFAVKLLETIKGAGYRLVNL